MKKNFRKILSVFCAFSLLFSCLPTGFATDDFEEKTDNEILEKDISFETVDLKCSEINRIALTENEIFKGLYHAKSGTESIAVLKISSGGSLTISMGGKIISPEMNEQENMLSWKIDAPEEDCDIIIFIQSDMESEFDICINEIENETEEIDNAEKYIENEENEENDKENNLNLDINETVVSEENENDLDEENENDLTEENENELAEENKSDLAEEKENDSEDNLNNDISIKTESDNNDSENPEQKDIDNTQIPENENEILENTNLQNDQESDNSENEKTNNGIINDIDQNENDDEDAEKETTEKVIDNGNTEPEQNENHIENKDSNLPEDKTDGTVSNKDINSDIKGWIGIEPEQYYIGDLVVLSGNTDPEIDQVFAWQISPDNENWKAYPQFGKSINILVDEESKGNFIRFKIDDTAFSESIFINSSVKQPAEKIEPDENKQNVTEETVTDKNEDTIDYDNNRNILNDDSSKNDQKIILAGEDFKAEVLSVEETNEIVQQFFAKNTKSGKKGANKSRSLNAASETKNEGYVAFDISLLNSEKNSYGTYTVPVVLANAIDVTGQRAEKGEKAVFSIVNQQYELYHIHENEYGELITEAVTVDAAADENGFLNGFTFETDGFSNYILKYTVDFHYNGIDYSIPGESQILFSELIEELQIMNGDSKLDLTDVESVSFTDEHLVTVEQVSGLIIYNDHDSFDVGDKDFLLSSLEPFKSNEVLTVVLNDNSTINVGTTDYTYKWPTIHLRGRDSVSLKEIVNERYTYNENHEYSIEVNNNNIVFIESNLTFKNLKSCPIEFGNWTYPIIIYDNTDGVKISVSIAQDLYYIVEKTGRIEKNDLLSALGIPIPEGGWYPYADFGEDYDNNPDNVIYFDYDDEYFLINSTDIPENGIIVELMVCDWEDYPQYYIIFVPEKSKPVVYQDGIFTYNVNKTDMTATVTGFVSGLSSDKKTNITIPKDFKDTNNDGASYRVTAIDDYAFYSDEYIQNITINAEYINIGNYAFRYCKKLTSVSQTVGGYYSYLAIGTYAFADCSKLKSFISEAGIKQIYGKAFSNDDNLETLVSGSSWDVYIGGEGTDYTNAFQNCSGELTFNAGIYYITWYTFFGSKVTKITTTHLYDVDERSFISSNYDIDLVLNINEAIDKLDADKLNYLLNKAQLFKNVTLNLNKGVNTICSDAFDKITYLSSIDSLKINIAYNENGMEIENNAIPNEAVLFVDIQMNHEDVTGSDLDSIKTVEDAGHIRYLDSDPIGEYHDDMFYYEVEDGKAIVSGLYTEETDWKEIEFNNKTRDNKYWVVGIKNEVLMNDNKIEKITFKNSNAFTINANSFAGMNALEEVIIQKPAVTLPEGVFADCINLKTVTIGSSENQYNSVSYNIPENAFANCSSLESFTIHFKITDVDKNAFKNCSGLKNVVFTGHGDQVIPNGAFTNSVNIEILRIDNLDKVENGAFNPSEGEYYISDNMYNWIPTQISGKIGNFENYIFTKAPWYLNNVALTGNNKLKTVYIADTFPANNSWAENAVANAGANVTVYFGFDYGAYDRQEELDIKLANSSTKIVYLHKTEETGLYIGSTPRTSEPDGSREKPFNTYEQLYNRLGGKGYNGQIFDETIETDDTIKDSFNGALQKAGVNHSIPVFEKIIRKTAYAYVISTINIAQDEIWDSQADDPINIVRADGFTGPMISVSSAGRTLTLKNIILDGGSQNGLTAADVIVKCYPGILNIQDGAVLQNNNRISLGNNNSAGAVYAENATVNMTGGVIRNNNGFLGGGIGIYGEKTVLNMSGGSIENNHANEIIVFGSYYYSNGGGVAVLCGATMNLSGGTIAKNTVTGDGNNWHGKAGGGISLGGAMREFGYATLNMTGGTISGNEAKNLGGGINIEDSCVANISGGSIINNTAYYGYFGGGGIYVNGNRGGVSGHLYLINPLITNNTAEEEGGGLAGCNTSDLDEYTLDGGAIYNNKSVDGSDLYTDTIVRNYQSSPVFHVSPFMGNGERYNWTNPQTGKVYEDSDLVTLKMDTPYDDGFVCMTVLKANPNGKQPTTGDVIISGNISHTKGGGIGSNGSVTIGRKPLPVNVKWTPSLTKTVLGRNMKNDEKFDFIIIKEEPTVDYYRLYFDATFMQDQIVENVSIKNMKDGETSAIPFDKEIDLGTYSSDDIGKKQYFDIVEMPVSYEIGSNGDEIGYGTYYLVTVSIGRGIDENKQETLFAYQTEYSIGKYTYNKTKNSFEFDYSIYHHTRTGDHKMRILQDVDKSEAGFINILPVTVSAEKVWENRNDSEAPENGKVVFELYADGVATGKTIELDGTPDENGENESWKAVWKNLDAFRRNEEGNIYKNKETDADYVLIQYSVKEISVYPEYYSAETSEPVAAVQEGLIKIVNKEHAGSLKLHKTWKGIPAGANLNKLTIVITDPDGTERRITYAEFDANGDYMVAENVPVGSVYSVRETNARGLIDGYTLVADQSIMEGSETVIEEEVSVIELVNTYTALPAPPPPEPEYIDIQGQKTWVDFNDQDGLRPENITINLYADGKLTARAQVTEKSGWTWTFKNLPKLNDNNKEIVYTIDEETAEGYISVINGFNVRNIRIPKSGELMVAKHWDDQDNVDGIRPESIRVDLLANGTVVRTFMLNERNNWSAIAENLPENENGKAIRYTWQEEDIEGYTATTTNEGNLTIITNTHKPVTITIGVRKIWMDNNNLMGIRPESIVMTLSNGMEVTLSEDNNWSAAIQDLPAMNHGEPIVYEWKEQEIAGYIHKDPVTANGITTFTNEIWARKQEEGRKIPGNPVRFFDDYETALGLESNLNHVGHCFD